MLVGVLLIVVGLMTIGWGWWLVPLQLGKVRQPATPKGQKNYDALMNRPAISRLFRSSAIVGGAAIVVGVVYLLIEL